MSAHGALFGRPLATRRAHSAALTGAGALAAVLAVGLGLRLGVAGRDLWLDETISVLQVDRSMGDVLDLQANGFHPPFYHLQLHFWIELFGTSPMALRSLSIAWSLVSVVAVWGWSREAFPSVSPLPAAAVVAVSPFAVWYGSEARMYSQLFALVALCGWLAWRVLARGATPARIAGLCAAFLGLVYTHYFASLFLLALGMVLLGLALTRREMRARALWILGAALAASLALMPWFVHVLASRSAPGSLPAYPDPDVFSALIAGLEMLVGFHSYSTMGLLAACWPLSCLGTMLALPFLYRMEWRASGLAVLVLVPPALLMLTSALLGESVFDPRYLTVATAPLYVVAGRGLAAAGAGGRVGTMAVVAVLLVGGTFAIRQAHDDSNPRLYQLETALDTVNRLAGPGDALVLVPQFTVAGLPKDPVLSYYPPSRNIRVISTIDKTQRVPAGAWRRIVRSGARRVFLVTSFDGPGAPAGLASPRSFLRYMARKGRTVERLAFTNVTLTIFDVRREVRRGAS